LKFDDNALLVVLLDDSNRLERQIAGDKSVHSKRYSLRCAYTPLYEVSLLHICAEFNHAASAEVLVKQGADVNAVAGTDEIGFGGQTPIFHTVNQNNNQSEDMMDLLIANHADLEITVKGIICGKGYNWETFIPSVNPLSYAMMGLLPPMHRDEKTIAGVVSPRMNHAYGINYKSSNVPYKYLNS
jgi:hypothetical protein